MQWKAGNVVIGVDGEPVVLLMPAIPTDLLNQKTFPHDRFAAVASAFELSAQDVVNPEAGEGYRASYDGPLTLPEILDAAQVTHENVLNALPSAADNASEGVELVVPHLSGAPRPIVLPKTEDVRKPSTTAAAPRDGGAFEAIVLGTIPEYGYLVLENGAWVSVEGSDPAAFSVGERYRFVEFGERTTFQKRLRHVTSDAMALEESRPNIQAALDL